MNCGFGLWDEKHPIAVIRNDQELHRANNVVSAILISGAISDGESRYLDVLSELIWAYEQKTDVIDSANDSGDILEVKALIEERAQLQNRASVLERCLSDGTQDCPGERADKRIQLAGMKLYIDALTSRIVRFIE